MPNRSTLNKYEMLVTDVRRLAKKKVHEITDMRVKKIAMLIASLSSNHSWKTSRYLHNNEVMDKMCMQEEARQAFTEGWKNINESDIEEVINSNISEHAFSMWLYNIVSKEQRHDFQELYRKIKIEFVDGLEPIERLVD
ncbi:MAG: hypothetical protein KGH54_00735 [Candidatus Micrarchaeota archaeon]|nr:hypothetical protein [Candidatus Micrarchaeota archaeon]